MLKIDIQKKEKHSQNSKFCSAGHEGHGQRTWHRYLFLAGDFPEEEMRIIL